MREHAGRPGGVARGDDVPAHEVPDPASERTHAEDRRRRLGPPSEEAGDHLLAGDASQDAGAAEDGDLGVVP